MPQTVSAAIKLLNIAKEATNHQFWPDSVSLLDPALFDANGFTQHSEITDSYLLALAVENKGRLVSLDQNIKTSTIVGIFEQQLQVI